MQEQTTITATPSQWSRLLAEAVSKPGLLLAAYSAFHNYSVGNQVLALMQCQQRGIKPGPLATFPGWKEKGRHVRKGERALTLCMPVTVRGKDAEGDDETFTRFIYCPRWFVLPQTEGQDVDVEPSLPPTWDKARALSALNITEMPFDLLEGNTQGYAKGRSISVSPIAVLPHKTVFHELAHVTLGHTAEGQTHDGEHTPRSLKEAEAVALILCETLQLPGAEYARGYIQNWIRGGTIPERSAQKIFHAADVILRAGQ